MVTSFRYLWRVILAVANFFPAVVQNSAKVRAVWSRITGILIREEAET